MPTFIGVTRAFKQIASDLNGLPIAAGTVPGNLNYHFRKEVYRKKILTAFKFGRRVHFALRRKML